MTATKLQTKVAHLALQRITVNGHTYDVDRECCVYVEDPADIAKLKATKWTDKISVVRGKTINRVPQSGQSLRGATEFVALLQQDEQLLAKVKTIRTFPALAAFVLDLGFKFTQADFTAAGQAHEEEVRRAKEIDDANAAKMKAKGKKEEQRPVSAPPPPAEEETLLIEPAAAHLTEIDAGENLSIEDSGFQKSVDLPEDLPEELSGVWPDPSEEMSLPYLRRMADAYGVQYPANISKHKLVLKLNDAVFAED